MSDQTTKYDWSTIQDDLQWIVYFRTHAPPPLFSLLGPVTQGIMSNKEKRPWCILSFEHYRLFVFRCVSLWGRVDNCNLFMVVIYILFEIRIWICCVCHWYLRHIVFVFLVVFVFVACVQAGVWWGRVGFLSAGSICPQVRCSQARIKMIRISHRITRWSWCWWPPKVAKKHL